MVDILAISVEVLILGRNLDTTLPTARTEVVVCTRIVKHATIDSQVIVVETRIHWALGSTSPNTILILAQYGTATATKTQAYNYRLSIGSLNTEAGVTLRVNHRILLSGLVHGVGHKVLFWLAVVHSGIKVADNLQRALSLEVLVERQWVIVYTQPRVLIAQVPECNVLNHILVLTENLEQTGILVLLQCLHITRLWFSLATREHQLTTALGIGTQIQLCNMDSVYNLAETVDSLLQLLLIREVDVIVTLHADTIDGHTSLLHLLHHIIYTLTFALVNTAVVVVHQHTCWVGLACKLKSLSNKLIATKLKMTALTIRAGRNHLTINKLEWTTVVGHSLVYYVPGINHILIAVNHGVDMLAQTLVEYFFLYGLTLLVGKHPVGKL